MEHKSWPWKKKSTEKTMVAADKVSRGNEDEADLTDKVELLRSLKTLDEKLSAALVEINAKDDIAKKQTNIAKEAIQGWEKAEAEVLALKQDLEKATQQIEADEERLHGADAALKECTLQLRFVREEQEKRIHDAVTKTSSEHEKRRMILEEKLAESNKMVSKLSLENTQLSKTLSAKEKVIDELHSIRAQLDYDLNDVVSRLESTQRENASLSYEVRVLEKELEIRNEEREFNRRTAEVAHKQYLGSVKKIAKLEMEAQRLRLLVQKRLPGPAALAKMKNAVEVLGKESAETTRRRSNPFPVASKDFIDDDASGKKIAFLTEQLSAFEEENRLLKEFLNQKTSELSKSQTAMGPARNIMTSHEFSMAASSSDMGSDEKVSMTESWAPSCNTVGASDIGLMDDFVEMEKLALVSVDKPFAKSSLVQEDHSHWLENLLKVIEEHARIMQRSSNDMLEDVKVALAGKKDANGYFSEESRTPEKTLDKDLDDEVHCHETPPTKLNNELLHSGMNKSIQRLVELIEGIRLSEKEDSLSPYKASKTPTGYTVHIFQWKTSEVRDILESFLQTCNKLLNRKVGVEDFAEELTSAMEWIVNHCFSLQDVSSMKEEIKKCFEWDETRSESEVEGGVLGQLSNADKLHFSKDQLPGWPMAASWNIRNKTFHLEELRPNVIDEVRKLKDELANLESANKDLRVKLQSESSKCASLIVKLQESERDVGSLQTGVNPLKDQKEILKDPTEVDITVKDLDKLRIETIDECNDESHQEHASTDGKGNNSSSNEELEVTHIRPESMIENDTKSCDLDHDDRTVQCEQEITAASEKLAECQETILNLGKQLKALATSPIDTCSSDKCEITASPLNNNNQRISLLDKMITEDATGAPRSQKPKEVTRALTSPAILDGNTNPIMSPQMFVSVEGVKDEKDEEALVNFLSIVPNKKKNSRGGILSRLFSRRTKRQ